MMHYFYVRTRLIVITFVLLSIYFTLKLITAHDKDGEGGWGFRARKRALLLPPVPSRASSVALNDTMKTLLNINVNCSAQHFYDVPEWTLQLFGEKEDEYGDIEEDCYHKRSVLFEKNMVKTVIRGNGYENRGCRNDTPKCAQGAHYDILHDIRVNTPPCCRAKIIEMFVRTTERLGSKNITHFIQFGGLIGYHRNKRMIPYDVDIDLYVDHEVWKKPAMVALIEEFRERYGFHFQYHDNGDKLKIFYSKMNNNSIDVWPFKIITNIAQRGFVHIPHWSAVDQPMTNIFPLRRVQFEGTWTYIPRKPIEVLNLQYGEGAWETEVSCRIYDSSGNCVPEKNERNSKFTLDVNEEHTIKYLLCFLFCFFVVIVSLFFLVIKCVSSPISISEKRGLERYTAQGRNCKNMM